MIIRPKRVKYEKTFRNKKNKDYKNRKLVFGTSGIKTLNKFVITTRQLNKYIIFIKKYIKKMEKTQKKFWFKYAITNPITKKPKGSRMGKGKGKPYIWMIAFYSGYFVFEFKNIRMGKEKFLLKKFNILFNSKILILRNKFRNNKVT